MKAKPRILGFVGARAGSKGLPGKNTRDLHGKPLTQWTLDALRDAEGISEVFLSTDDMDLMEKMRACGYGSDYQRPEVLAGDDAKIGDAILDAVRWLELKGVEPFDYVMLAQATSPLRTSEDIDAAISQYFEMQKSETETLVSVYQAPAKTGWLTHQGEEGYLEFTFAKGEAQPRQRQKLDTWYYPNGAMYLAPLKDFKGEFYSAQTQMFVMPESKSVDIDTLEDFQRVEKLMS